MIPSAEIAELDKTLGMLRDGWMTSKDEHRDAWMKRLNQMLDERLRLMKLRDRSVKINNP